MLGETDRRQKCLTIRCPLRQDKYLLLSSELLILQTWKQREIYLPNFGMFVSLLLLLALVYYYYYYYYY
jgi:hypothetical protein